MSCCETHHILFLINKYNPFIPFYYFLFISCFPKDPFCILKGCYFDLFGIFILFVILLLCLFLPRKSVFENPRELWQLKETVHAMSNSFWKPSLVPFTPLGCAQRVCLMIDTKKIHRYINKHGTWGLCWELVEAFLVWDENWFVWCQDGFEKKLTIIWYTWSIL